MDYMDYEATIRTGDVVWWPRVLTGRVRAIRLEEPSFVYAVVETDPDRRLLMVPMPLLTKGSAPDPIPVINEQESTEDALP